MYKSQEIQIKRFSNGAWWFTTTEGQEYRITSINNHCTQKLQALYEENNGQAYMTLEKITEYHSRDYRCKVSRVSTAEGWLADDVYCLVSNETGNLNPNAERDIAQADKILEKLQWAEVVKEANEIAATRAKHEKASCIAARDTSGLGYWNCDCSDCWHNEFENCICGRCTKHD